MHLFGITFGEGNIKLGEVFTFSLPSVITCPGASIWCKKYCYSLSYERLRPTCRSAYEQNLLLAKDPKQFEKIIIGVLPRILPCMRIHVSGDFWSKEYIESWIKICLAFPQTKFWTYTRSWTVPNLVGPLEQLRLLPNIEIFASTDPTMPNPPDEWRAAFIDSDERSKGLRCSQQEELLNSCLECGYCFRKEKGDVIFKVH